MKTNERAVKAVEYIVAIVKRVDGREEAHD